MAIVNIGNHVLNENCLNHTRQEASGIRENGINVLRDMRQKGFWDSMNIDSCNLKFSFLLLRGEAPIYMRH